jgi:hypothetical protein
MPRLFLNEIRKNPAAGKQLRGEAFFPATSHPSQNTFFTHIFRLFEPIAKLWNKKSGMIKLRPKDALECGSAAAALQGLRHR